MRPVVWFRAAAVFLLLFAAGHTVGFLGFKPPTAASQAVWSSMNSVRFVSGGSSFSYGGFYVGFGLFITLFFVCEALLAWYLGGMAQRGIREASPIAGGMVALHLIGLGLSWRYFSFGPVIMSVIVAALLSMAAFTARRSADLRCTA